MADAQRHLADEAATIEFGRWLSQTLKERYDWRAVVFLHGQLGAGKTTVVRGLLQGLGYSGVVKSPTYTLLEPYNIDGVDVYHFDLYRVADPQELEFVGIDEIVDGPGLKLFEWPENAESWLPNPDVRLRLVVDAQTEPPSRRVTLEYRLESAEQDVVQDDVQDEA